MNLFHKIKSWFRGMFGKRQLDLEMDEEMRAHVEMRKQANLESGMSADEAQRAAAVEFGLAESLKETCRDERGVKWIADIVQDGRYGIRQLMKTPGFTAVALLTLAFGICANTIVFSLVDEVLLKMLPVKNPEELVLFHWGTGSDGWPHPVEGDWEDDPASKGSTCTSFSGLAFKQFVNHNDVCSDVFAFAPLNGPRVSVNGEVEVSTAGQLVSGNYFSGLGATAEIGRLIDAGDDQPQSSGVAVISHRFWQARFGGESSVVGKPISVNGIPVVVIGVTQQSFPGTMDVGETPDISLPLSLTPQIVPDRSAALNGAGQVWWLRIMGRLKSGVSMEQARFAFAGVFRQTVMEDMAATADKKTTDLPRLGAGFGGRGLMEGRHTYRRELMILCGLVAAVLLLACLNLASLLLVRGAAREKEVAVRLALGAGNWRIVRQYLTESGLLALAGCVLGVLLGYWARGIFNGMHPLRHEDGRPLVLNLDLDWRVLVFTAIASIATGLLFGIVPALRAARVDPGAGAQSSRETRRGYRSRISQILIASQVAGSLVILVAAGLMGRSLEKLRHVDVGFNRDHLLLFRIDATDPSRNETQNAVLYSSIVESIASIPGVQSAAYAAVPPLSSWGWSSRIVVPNSPSRLEDRDTAMMNAVSPTYFRAMQMPILFGRAITPLDSARSSRVAFVNQTMARHYFGMENAVGRHFQRDGEKGLEDTEVVGIVRDAKYNNVKNQIPATVYLAFDQASMPDASYILRATGNPEAMVDVIRRTVRKVDANLPLLDVRTQDAQVELLFSQQTLFAQLSTFFGIFALGLVCIGLYGVISYAALRRTNEFGVRLAIGAQRRDIIGLTLFQGLGPVLAGLAVGILAAALLTRFIASLLYGVGATDLITFCVTIGAILVAASSACLIPARRAANLDPLQALRHE